MKKLLIGAVSAVALSFAFSAPASAGNVSDFCKANNDFAPVFSSHGDCTGSLNKSIVDFCKALHEGLPPAFYEAIFGGTGRGACISTIRHQVNDAL